MESRLASKTLGELENTIRWIEKEMTKNRREMERLERRNKTLYNRVRAIKAAQAAVERCEAEDA